MSLDTSGLCKLVHKKSDFYESSSRSNELISEPSENIFNRKNKSTSGQLLPLVCLQANQFFVACVRVKGQRFYFLNIYSLFNLNPSDYELQAKETGVSADQ